MKLSNEEGSTLVEFAISTSVLFMALFGIISLSLALYSYNFIAEAARDATRYAIVRGSSCLGLSDCGIAQSGLNTYVQGLNYPGIDSTQLSATASWSPDNNPGSTVSVTVTYNFPMSIPFWVHSGSIIRMSSTSSMVISQ